MEQVLLEKWKAHHDSNTTVFYTTIPLFKEAIVALGGDMKVIHSLKGKEIGWEIWVKSSGEKEIIDICRELKKSLQE